MVHNIMYIKYLEESTKNLPQPVSDFYKVTGYKSRTQKLNVFQQTNNKKVENKIKYILYKSIKELKIYQNT